MSDDTLDTLVSEARDGNRASLEELITRIQPRVHAVALRMLWHPDDAADATQEILIRIITHLASFRGESSFITWAHRVACNYLLTCRRSRVERQELTFEDFAEDLRDGLGPPRPEWSPEDAVLLEEVKVGCMLAMLQCLDRRHRLAYVVGEILEFTGPEAAAILGVSPLTFRKRLSRARAALLAFTRAHCGLIDDTNACRCARRLPAAIARGRVTPNALLFAGPGRVHTVPELRRKVEALESARKLAVLYRTQSAPDMPNRILLRLDALLEQCLP